jgi:RNA polymerase-binding protein DksA
MVTVAVQNEIRQRLLKRKERIEKILSSFATKSATGAVDFSSEYPDLGDEEEENALEVSMYSDRVALEATLERILEDISQTLRRMDEGTYGICRYCKKEIPEARLQARPVSSACVQCKETLKKAI